MPEKALQFNSMDDRLRNALWNTLCRYFWHTGAPVDSTQYLLERKFNGHPAIRVASDLWSEHLGQPIDELPADWDSRYQEIRDIYFDLPWNEVYDLIEFIAPHGDSVRGGSSEGFCRECNRVLERECSAWRFVGVQVARITDVVEIDEVKEAIASPHEGIRTQLKSALTKYADRVNPDYRNSIKESISAVETVVNLINGTENSSLGDALKKIGDTIDLHPALAKGLDSIYGWTCDDNAGIRHGMMEKTEITSADARFMLVSCSAFVNYLIAKADQAGISLGS